MISTTPRPPKSRFSDRLRPILVAFLFVLLFKLMWIYRIDLSSSPSPLSLTVHAFTKELLQSFQIDYKPKIKSHRLNYSSSELQEKRTAKKNLCKFDLNKAKYALQLIKVDQPKRSPKLLRPRLLCYVMTYSGYHSTRVQAVRETWGQRCDKLLIFSDEADPSMDIVKLDAPSDYKHLWLKNQASLKYVYDHYGQDYDWFYKADDDTYLIVDNLKKYLNFPEIQSMDQTTPLFLGRRFILDKRTINGYIKDKDLLQSFYEKATAFVFNVGGPGYAMNRLFLEKMYESIGKSYCLSEKDSTMPEDVAISFCMGLHSVFPYQTRDHLHRERWHAFDPKGAYFTDPNTTNSWYVDYHKGIGGLNWKENCCAEYSIAFHYGSPKNMYHFERQLYYCRDEEVLDLQEYNWKWNVNISSEILKKP